jgi:hypothetical protein
MTGSHRFPTGSRNHSHDRFPVPHLYRGTGTGGGSELLFPLGAGTSQGTTPAPPERSDDELYEQWLESDTLIDLELTRGGQSDFVITPELRQPTVGRILFGGRPE